MINSTENKDQPQLLLHICCGPDATAVYERLKNDYDITGYFFNPNIDSLREYYLRAETAEKVASEMGFPIIVAPYQPEAWNLAVKGLESEPERGQRCQVCFRFNLRAAALAARGLNIMNFTTTLTLSPHKDAQLIFDIGGSIAKETGLKFLNIDFKKKDGFKLSLELSKSLNLFRQDYCGCRFSRRIRNHA